MTKYKYLLGIVVTLFAITGYSQSQNWSFGLQFKPMLPDNWINPNTVESNVDGVNFATYTNFGYNGGVSIRRAITKKISVESGISFTQRNYSTIITEENNTLDQLDFRIIAYEVPFKAVFQVQLDRKWKMGGFAGFVCDLYPSNVGTFGDNYYMRGFYRNWIQPASSFGVGWERKLNKGAFVYFGFDYHLILNNYNYVERIAESGNEFATASMGLTGNYLAADIRIYLPTKN